eukprot:TRINITY_DN24029_c0_g1_i2.p1 TRINITY_DN24029_c0_g1~~TRINITY_DN24029_c0_g1_i2.p1  ORF type:complete len:203 (-),score=31.83 TRINITY_DN24029_c0_g1_i2:92-700(-)
MDGFWDLFCCTLRSPRGLEDHKGNIYPIIKPSPERPFAPHQPHQDAITPAQNVLPPRCLDVIDTSEKPFVKDEESSEESSEPPVSSGLSRQPTIATTVPPLSSGGSSSDGLSSCTRIGPTLRRQRFQRTRSGHVYLAQTTSRDMYDIDDDVEGPRGFGRSQTEWVDHLASFEFVGIEGLYATKRRMSAPGGPPAENSTWWVP